MALPLRRRPRIILTQPTVENSLDTQRLELSDPQQLLLPQTSLSERATVYGAEWLRTSPSHIVNRLGTATCPYVMPLDRQPASSEEVPHIKLPSIPTTSIPPPALALWSAASATSSSEKSASIMADSHNKFGNFYITNIIDRKAKTQRQNQREEGSTPRDTETLNANAGNYAGQRAISDVPVSEGIHSGTDLRHYLSVGGQANESSRAGLLLINEDISLL